MTDEQTTTNNQPETNADGGGSESPETTTFTQAQVDTIIADRLKRSKVSTTNELLESLGVETLEAATKAVKDAAATKAAQMTELEKAQAETVTASEALVKVQAEMESTRATAAEALLRAAVISAATGFNDPNDAWTLIDKSSVEVQTDGTYKGIDEAIKALLESKPYLAKTTEKNLGTPTRNNKNITQAWQNQQQSEKPALPRKPITRF